VLGCEYRTNFCERESNVLDDVHVIPVDRSLIDKQRYARASENVKITFNKNINSASDGFTHEMPLARARKIG